MERDSIEEAREFWERFDLVRGVRTVKDVAESIGISYELIRVQRTRLRTPRLYLAVSIAKELGTTVEYLSHGRSSEEHFSSILHKAYIKASESNKKIVDIALGLSQDNTQTEMMSV